MSMIKISFVGDIMCEPLMLKAAKRGNNYDFSGVFSNVKELLLESDYVIGNLETPLAGKKAKFVNELFLFNAPDEFAEAVKNAGIDFVSTANNHCMDRGLNGLKRTISVLDDIGLAHDGTYKICRDAEPFVVSFGDLSVAIISFTYGINYSMHHRSLPEDGYVDLLHSDTAPVYILKKRKFDKIKKILFRPFKTEQIAAIKKYLGMEYNTPRKDDYLNEEEVKPYFEKLKRKIQKAKKYADVVIFYPHVGGQFNIEPGIFSEYTVKKAIEYGVDVIIASHPHIVQKATMNGEVPVFYSIGNFSMSPNSVYLLHENLPEYGIIPHLYIDNNKIVKVTFSIIYITEKNNKILTVHPVDELITNGSCIESTKLEEGVRKIYRTVTGKDISNSEIIKKEYLLFTDINIRN